MFHSKILISLSGPSLVDPGTREEPGNPISHLTVPLHPLGGSRELAGWVGGLGQATAVSSALISDTGDNEA